MPLPDTAITASGNLAVLQNGLLGVVAGNSRICQDLYIALVEMPAQLVIGKQYKSILQIEEDLRNYLDARLRALLPFPVAQLQFRIRRAPDESVAVVVTYPSVDIANQSNDIGFKFQGRGGYQAQLIYDFSPILTAVPASVETVTERIVIETAAIRVPLTFDYSGDGPILFFTEEAIPQTEIAEVDIVKVPKVRKYNLLDYYTNEFLVDTVQVVSGTQLLGQMPSDIGSSPSLVPFEKGTPFIYFNADVDDGSTVRVRIRASNGDTYARSADIVENPNTEKVFPLKLTRNISVALLASPLQPGAYKAIYNARIRYRGNPD